MRASSGNPSLGARSSLARRRDAGFTLIEVMIAMLVTAVAIIGIMALYMTQTRAGSYSRHTSEASVLATDGLERMRTVATPTASSTSGLNEQGNVVSGGLFTRTTTVTTNGTFYDLTVTVTWSENNVSKTVTVNGRRNL